MFIDNVTPLPQGLLPDIIEPSVTGQLLHLEETSFWQDGSQTSTKTMAHSNDRETLMCLLTGEMKIAIVPSWERILVFAG